MSVAVAVKKNKTVILATDSQTSFGGMRVPTDNLFTKKMHKIGPSYLATTGWGLYENILDDFLSKNRSADIESKNAIFSFFMKLWKELHNDYPFVKDQSDKEDESPFGNLDAQFLVISPQGIFHVGTDMSVTAFQKYYAIGSGADYALGAISAVYSREEKPEIIARTAVTAAMDFDLHCSGSIDLAEISLESVQK